MIRILRKHKQEEVQIQGGFETINIKLYPLFILFSERVSKSRFPGRNSKRAEHVPFLNFLTVSILVNLCAVNITTRRTSDEYQHLIYARNSWNARVYTRVGG